jgi:hypothetical protein
MNQIADEKLEAAIKTLSKEDAFFILQMAKELSEVKAEGFGRIVVDVQDKEISNWWKITSHTARNFRRKLRNLGNALLEKV